MLPTLIIAGVVTATSPPGTSSARIGLPQTRRADGRATLGIIPPQGEGPVLVLPAQDGSRESAVGLGVCHEIGFLRPESRKLRPDVHKQSSTIANLRPESAEQSQTIAELRSESAAQNQTIAELWPENVALKKQAEAEGKTLSASLANATGRVAALERAVASAGGSDNALGEMLLNADGRCAGRIVGSTLQCAGSDGLRFTGAEAESWKSRVASIEIIEGCNLRIGGGKPRLRRRRGVQRPLVL